MDLILWRHAEAAPGEPDMDRPLTPKGQRQAARVGAWLDHRLPKSCRILASPATRAQQTAAALERRFKTNAELAPDVSPQRILAVAGWPDARETIVIVGHQPTLGQAAALLMAGEAAEWWMQKGAVWWLSNRERSRGPAVVLRVAMAADFV
jgi:phosphohistidine phosphatase